MKKLILSTLVILISVSLKAQSLDSAFIAVNSSDYKKAIKICNEIISNNEGKDQIGEAYFTIGYSYKKLGDVKQAIKNYFLSTEKANTEECKARALINIAIIYKSNGLYAEAVKLYNQALKLKISDNRRISYLINRSIVLKRLAKHDSAYIDMNKALLMANKLNDVKAKSKVMNQLGLIAKDLEDYQEAIYYFELANREKSSYKTYHNLGEVYKEIDNYDSAEINYKKSIALSKNIITLFKSRQSLGELYQKNGDTTKALFHLSKAEKLLANLENIEVEDLEIFTTLASCYNSGTKEKELYLNKEIASLREINKQQEVLKTQYRKLYISSFKKQYDNEKQQDLLYQKNIKLVWLIFCFILLFGLTSFFTVRHISKNRRRTASISKNINEMEKLTKQPII